MQKLMAIVTQHMKAVEEKKLKSKMRGKENVVITAGSNKHSSANIYVNVIYTACSGHLPVIIAAFIHNITMRSML